MALTDLIIRPRVEALRYAASTLDSMRLVFDDIARGRYEPDKVRKLARSMRGAAISAKFTIEDAIEDAAALRKGTSNV
jgi:hypothetical protein